MSLLQLLDQMGTTQYTLRTGLYYCIGHKYWIQNTTIKYMQH